MLKYLIFSLTLFLPFSCFATNPNLIQVYPQQNVIQRHSVEFDAQTYLGVPAYISTMDKQKIENIRENAVDKKTVGELVTIVKALLAEKVKTPEVQTDPLGLNTQQIKSGNLDFQVFQLFKAHCLTCHSDSSTNGLKLVSGNGLYDLPAQDRAMVYFRVAGGQALKDNDLALMPQNGKQLSNEDAEILKSWAIKKILLEKSKK